jgi:ribosomal protein S18 acetylase RimI-like enzyme
LFRFEKDSTDFNTIKLLAEEIWPDTYSHILSQEQLRFMLDLFYHPNALKLQHTKQKHRFIIAYDEHNAACGFASFSKMPDVESRYRLHKLYILPKLQGCGLGKAFIQLITEEIQRDEPVYLELNVNRFNSAISFHKKCGFSIIREEDIEIGNGYFMNDYVMEKMI